MPLSYVHFIFVGKVNTKMKTLHRFTFLNTFVDFFYYFSGPVGATLRELSKHKKALVQIGKVDAL